MGARGVGILMRECGVYRSVEVAPGCGILIECDCVFAGVLLGTSTVCLGQSTL